MKEAIPLEYGQAKGAVLVTTANSPYTPSANCVVYAVVPNPSWTGKAIAEKSTQFSMTADKTQAGSAITTPIMVPFYGRYTSVTVSSGSCIVYERGA